MRAPVQTKQTNTLKGVVIESLAVHGVEGTQKEYGTLAGIDVVAENTDFQHLDIKHLKLVQADSGKTFIKDVNIDKLEIIGDKTHFSDLVSAHIVSLGIENLSICVRLNVSRSVFDDVSIFEGIFNHTTFTGVSFINCTFCDTKFVETTFHLCRFAGCSFIRCSFINPFIGSQNTFTQCYFGPGCPVPTSSDLYDWYKYYNMKGNQTRMVGCFGTSDTPNLFTSCHDVSSLVISDFKKIKNIARDNSVKTGKIKAKEVIKNTNMAYIFSTAGVYV